MSDLKAMSAEANARRYNVDGQRGRNRHKAMADDLFPEARVDPTLDGDQRYTTRETDQWCRAKAGVDSWDLDVAACEESHLAARFFSKADDGLMQHWSGRVWCNPPFSDIEPWVAKAWANLANCPVIAMLLPASRTEQRWWHEWVEPFRDGVDPACLPTIAHNTRGKHWPELRTHFLPGRTRFGHPGNPEGVGVGSPPFGCVLLVWKGS